MRCFRCSGLGTLSVDTKRDIRVPCFECKGTGAISLAPVKGKA
jgi:excinuclease UvrABC ATPase subunit